MKISIKQMQVLEIVRFDNIGITVTGHLVPAFKKCKISRVCFFLN